MDLEGLRAFCPANVVSVLEVVFDGAELPVREVARRAGLSPASTAAVLDRLVEHGLVRNRRVGAMLLHSVNAEHLVVEGLRALLGPPVGA